MEINFLKTGMLVLLFLLYVIKTTKRIFQTNLTHRSPDQAVDHLISAGWFE